MLESWSTQQARERLRILVFYRQSSVAFPLEGRCRALSLSADDLDHVEEAILFKEQGLQVGMICIGLV